MNRNIPHCLCVNSFLLVSRCHPDYQSCVTLSCNNMLQQPNLLNKQVLVGFGFIGGDLGRKLEWTLSELTTGKMASMESARSAMNRGGQIIAMGGAYFKEFTIEGHESEFIHLMPDGFILVVDVSFRTDTSNLSHFEGVVNKDGTYWLLLGVRNSRVIRLGDVFDTAKLLFTADGRKKLKYTLVMEYKNAGDVVLTLGGVWNQNYAREQLVLQPIILVPSMTCPYGPGKSI